MLRNQTRIQCIKTLAALTESFEGVTLRAGVHANRKEQQSQRGNEKRSENEAASKRQCHNCGTQGHYAADCSSRCRGMKCYNYEEFGHIAVKC